VHAPCASPPYSQLKRPAPGVTHGAPSAGADGGHEKVPPSLGVSVCVSLGVSLDASVVVEPLDDEEHATTTLATTKRSARIDEGCSPRDGRANERDA